MISMQMFRSALSKRRALERALQIVCVAALAAPALVLGCGGKVAVDRDAGDTGEGGGGAGGRSGGSSGNVDGGPCALIAHGAGAGQTKLPECFARPELGCPKQYDAVLHIVPSSNCVYLVSVDCGPVELGEHCCYMVTEEEKSCE